MTICKKCSEYEPQLKEDLDELISIRMINELLQKELLSRPFIFFLLYINDLPTVTAESAKLVLYADDTSFIITNPSPIEFADKLNKVFSNVNEWFRNNLLFLNFNKTTYLQFRTKDSQKLSSNIKLLNNQITNSTNTKFLGLTIEEMLSWKCHINQILSRLSSACYGIKVITPPMSEDILKMIYYS